MSNDGGTLDEPLLQFGCGQKISYDEMNDGATDEVSDNYFIVTNVKQVKVKKFRTMDVHYTVQFMNMFAHLELPEFHNCLNEIFQSVLDTITRDICNCYI